MNGYPKTYEYIPSTVVLICRNAYVSEKLSLSNIMTFFSITVIHQKNFQTKIDPDPEYVEKLIT